MKKFLFAALSVFALATASIATQYVVHKNNLEQSYLFADTLWEVNRLSTHQNSDWGWFIPLPQEVDLEMTIGEFGALAQATLGENTMNFTALPTARFFTPDATSASREERLQMAKKLIDCLAAKEGITEGIEYNLYLNSGDDVLDGYVWACAQGENNSERSLAIITNSTFTLAIDIQGELATDQCIDSFLKAIELNH